MKHALGSEGRAALASVMAHRPLLAFDFDGTLAPIVPRPDEAFVPLPVARRLARLAERWPVAIVTGRTVDDVLPRVGFRPDYVIGNHGAEDPTAGDPAIWVTRLDPVRRRLETCERELADAGITVEDKRLSIALHYRLAPHRGRAMALIESVLAGHTTGLQLSNGKCVVNILADGSPDKGDAVQALVRRCGAGAALFVGDDINDESVFAKAPPDWMTIRVGRDYPQSRARFFLDIPSHLTALLQALIDLPA